MTIYNDICSTLDKVRQIRKRYTDFYIMPELRPVVEALLKCEDELMAEGRKWCSSTKEVEL